MKPITQRRKASPPLSFSAPPPQSGAPRRAAAATVALFCALTLTAPAHAAPSPRLDSNPSTGATAEAQCEGAMDLPQLTGAAATAQAEPPNLTSLREAAPYREIDKTGDLARLAMVRQSALSLGMRAGFNRGIWCHQEEIKARAAEIDRTYNFRFLLFEAGGGFMYEPGIVIEEFDNRKIEEDGTRAAAASARIAMATKEHLVTRARDWRQYLVVETEPLAPQAPEMRPLPDDKAQWQAWLAEGWKRGLRQANNTMDELWSRLEKDYLGMVAYRRLVLEKKINPPRSVVTDRGVTGNANEIRIGDVQVETRRQGQLQPNAAQWRSLPFITPPPPTKPEGSAP